MNIETGHFIRIQIPARARTLWLSPAWAVVCGIVASNAFTWNGRDVLIAILAARAVVRVPVSTRASRYSSASSVTDF